VTPLPSIADRSILKLVLLARGSVTHIVSSLGHRGILLASAETTICLVGIGLPATQKSVALSCIHRVRMFRILRYRVEAVREQMLHFKYVASQQGGLLIRYEILDGFESRCRDF
jgi:hypothetical protein